MTNKPVTQKQIKTLISRAESICSERKCRLTPIRKKVLSIIWQSQKPIKAYDILAKLSTSEHVEKPPTVYRALQFLLDNHLIHRIESSNGYIGCELDHEGLDSKFFICDECKQVAEVDESKLNRILSELSKKQGFAPNHINIEIHGKCANCAS